MKLLFLAALLTCVMTSLSHSSQTLTSATLNPSVGAATSEVTEIEASADFGSKEVFTVTTVPLARSQEITKISTVRDFGSSLSGKYFFIDSVNSWGGYYVWMDVNTGSADPKPSALPNSTGIKVTLSANASANTVATQVASAIDAKADFVATAATNIVTVTDASVGTVVDAYDVNSGFVVSTYSQGSKSIDGRYFLAYSGGNSTADYVWFDVNGTSVNPAPAGRSGHKVTIPNVATANDVATYLKDTMNTTPGYTATVSDNVVTITNKRYGVSQNATDVNTGMTISQVTEGVEGINSRFFVILTANDAIKYDAWISVNGAGSGPTADGTKLAINVQDTDSVGSVARKVATVLDSLAGFSATALNGTITVANTGGNSSDANGGTLAWGTTVTTQGAAADLTVVGPVSAIDTKTANLYCTTTQAISGSQAITVEASPSDSGDTWVATSITATPSATVGTTVSGTAATVVARRLRAKIAASITSGIATCYLVQSSL